MLFQLLRHGEMPFKMGQRFRRPFLEFWIVATEATADKFCRQ
jgi:hypothetical protein